MRVRDLKRYLDEQENISQTKVESENWLKMNDFLSFIVNSQEGMAPVYISKKNIFLYALIVPEDKISGDYIDDLLNWSFRISHGYGYGYSYANQEKTPFLSEPMDSARPDLLEGSIPIFFLRDCFNHTLTKLEINQKISHVLEICWSKDRGAFSKFNDIGDYEDISTMENTKDL
ncbi:MAG: hypothetical protein U1C19_07765, partial [Methanobacteriaceae archaeon]|nr:hypothetical protein [Methanobacteriaceae archaeon]